MSAVSEGNRLFVPVAQDEIGKLECVEIDLDTLADDPTDVVDVMKLEFAPLSVWLRLAVEYYKRGRVQQFQDILAIATSDEATEAYGQYNADGDAATAAEKQRTYNRDRIDILNTLGAYHLEVARVAAQTRTSGGGSDAVLANAALGDGSNGIDTRAVEAARDTANSLFNQAADIDQYASTTWVGKGLLTLHKATSDADIETALSNFDNAISLAGAESGSTAAHVLPALLGKACCLYHLGKYQAAIQLYRQALIDSPNCPGFVRLGLARCYYRLNMLPKARRAFERVLDLDPQSVDALVALGVMELNAAHASASAAAKASAAAAAASKDGSDAPAAKAAVADAEAATRSATAAVAASLRFFERAYKIDPHNPMALNHLANHLFYRKDFSAVRRLASKAASLTDNERIRGESAFHIARSYHAEGDFQAAFTHYRAAVAAAPKHSLAQFGLAQMHADRGENAAAVASLETIYDDACRDYNVLYTLGVLYIETGAAENARKVLGRAVSLFPTAVDARVELARASERCFPDVAYCQYAKALALLKTQRKPIPYELWNNTGVVAARVQKFTEARLSYKKALSGAQTTHAALIAIATAAPPPASETVFTLAPSTSVSSSSAMDVDGETAKDGDNNDGDDGANLLNTGLTADDTAAEVAVLSEIRLYASRGGKKGDANAAAVAAPQSTDEVWKHIHVYNVSIVFNLGCLYEQQAQLGKAAATFRLILRRFAHYVDAHTRLGYLCQRSGRQRLAERHWKRAVSIAASQKGRGGKSGKYDPTFDLLLASQRLAQDHHAHAMKRFKEVLKKQPANAYALVGLGNTHLAVADTKRSHGEVKERAQALAKAAECYTTVLANDETNVYAAQGLGCLQAKQGRFALAKEAMLLVRDAAAAVGDGGGGAHGGDVYCNLGHLYAAQGQWINALKAYDTCLAKSAASKHAAVLQYEARVHYLSGDGRAANRCLLKSLHLQPTNVVTWYNLAITQEDYAVHVLQTPKHLRTCAEVELAVTDLQHACRTFARLAAPAAGASSKASALATKAQAHLTFSEGVLKGAYPHLEDARRRAVELKAQEDAALLKKADFDAAVAARAAEKAAAEAAAVAARREAERVRELERKAMVEQWQRDKLHAADYDDTPADADETGAEAAALERRPEDDDGFVVGDAEYKDGAYGGGDDDIDALFGDGADDVDEAAVAADDAAAAADDFDDDANNGTGNEAAADVAGDEAAVDAGDASPLKRKRDALDTNGGGGGGGGDVDCAGGMRSDVVAAGDGSSSGAPDAAAVDASPSVKRAKLDASESTAPTASGSDVNDTAGDTSTAKDAGLVDLCIRGVDASFGMSVQ